MIRSSICRLWYCGRFCTHRRYCLIDWSRWCHENGISFMICLLFYYVSLHPVRKKSDNLYTLYSSERCGSGHIFQNFSDLLANFWQMPGRNAIFPFDSTWYAFTSWSYSHDLIFVEHDFWTPQVDTSRPCGLGKIMWTFRSMGAYRMCFLSDFFFGTIIFGSICKCL